MYLLFAHEAYCPTPGREINTSLVAAATLLRSRVRQPDGTRIHERLTRGRHPGEIVPLAMLTHELDGGMLWPQVGDWRGSTADLLQLIHDLRFHRGRLSADELRHRRRDGAGPLTAAR